MHGAGILGESRGLAATGVRALRTRLELLEIEIATEQARIVRRLAVAAAGLYLLSFGTLLAILWVILALPDDWTVAALGGVALAFLAGGTAAGIWLARGDAGRKPLLATMIAVLKRDEDALLGTSA